MQRIRSISILPAMAAAILVAACGGGGGGDASAPAATNPPDNQPTGPKLIGKAIDGYLVGATVCVDQNNSGTCDAGEPSTITDAQGNYNLPDAGNTLGQTLLVTVTPQTKDLSRPDGFTFPASFTMSQIVTANGEQHITPLSTLVTAQMQTGLSQAQATAAVSQLLGGIDPNVDYVAAGDAATLGKAIAIIDKLATFATNGVVDAATVRNTMNAIVAKGDIASVTTADVQAQADKPVYAGANASAVLANPTYALDGILPHFLNYQTFPEESIVQSTRQVVGNQIVTTQYELSSGTWQPVTGNKFETLLGVYQLKADATWSDFVPNTVYRAPLPVTVNGAKLSGVDAVTGSSYNYEIREVDMGGRKLADAVPTNYGIDKLWQLPAMTGRTFAAGSKAVVGLLSYNSDQIILPTWVVPCDDTAVTGAFTCGGAIPAITENGLTTVVTGDAARQYTSVQQVFGINLVGRAGEFSLYLDPDNTVKYVFYTDTTPTIYDAGTWKQYDRNKDALILELNQAALATVGNDPILTPVNDGAKLVVALHNGHLKLGWFYPATYAQKTYQFQGQLNAELLDGVKASLRPR